MKPFLMLMAVAATGATMLLARPGSPTTTFIPAATVDSAFEQGRPLLETAAYKIHASRRDGPGMAEVHTRDTDIVYVLDGTATLITGGEVVDGKTTASDEIRGQSIRGGQLQRLSKGDVIVIPNGVPHWFKEVQAPFRYYVVKTTVGGGK
jgi:glc operon protein GlcG